MKKNVRFILLIVVIVLLCGTASAKGHNQQIPINYADFLLSKNSTPYGLISDKNNNIIRYTAVLVLNDVLDAKPDLNISFKTKGTIPIYVVYNVAHDDALLFYYRLKSKKYILVAMKFKGKEITLTTDFTTVVEEKSILEYVDDSFVKYQSYNTDEVKDGFFTLHLIYHGNIENNDWWKRLKPY